MPTVPTPAPAPAPLPELPDLGQLRRQARELQRTTRAADPDTPFPLAAAQRAVARRYGFPTWAALKHHLEVVTVYTRVPGRTDAGDTVADEFLRYACLTYERDEPARRAYARELLAAHPDIARADFSVAAAMGDAETVARFLRADPSAANRDGGPYRCVPLFWLAYARHDPTISRDAVVDTAQLLLAHGADPNAGYLWHGLPTPFTLLTGVFGHGEQGPIAQPAHPHADALARRLLEHGADANDAQTLYNRQFEAADDHLVLLFEFGLGQGDGGPWRARLGAALESPVAMVRGQLAWAIAHGMRARVELLVAHGVDLDAPLANGRTPVEHARVTGHADLAELLVGQGAREAELAPIEHFVAAALTGDATSITELRAEYPGIVDAARAARPSLVLQAVVAERFDVVPALVGLGFDVDAFGRCDIPIEEPREGALHRAAEVGDVVLTRTLLDLGADPNARDVRFGATPLGWARHFDQTEVAAVLEPVTAPDPDE